MGRLKHYDGKNKLMNRNMEEINASLLLVLIIYYYMSVKK